jgi:hypothetical protein
MERGREERVTYTEFLKGDQGCQMVCFQTENRNVDNFFEGLAMEVVGIFYGQLVYFTAIRYILRSFGIFCGTLVLFSPCW